MKKLLQIKFMLLLCALIVGSGTMWADEVTLVSGSGTSGYTIPDGWTSSGTVEGGSYLKLDGGTITSPEFAPHTGLSFTYSVATFGSGTNHPLTIRILNASTNDVIVEKVTSTPSSSSYITTGSPLSLGDVDVAFKIQLSAPTGKGIRLRNYSVTGTPAGGGSSLSDSDLALTNDPVALSFDLYNNSSAQTVSFTTSSTGAVTVSGGEGYVTTSVSGNAITVTPTAVTPSAQTITVNQAADNNYKKGSATFTVTITDSTPGFTVTLGDDNTALTEVPVGSGVTLPERTTTVTGYTFAGWSETNVSIETTTAPTIIPAGTYYPTDDITLYPVYTKTVGGGGTTHKSASVTISDYAGTNSWVNSNQYTSIGLDENVTATASGGGNTGKYYTNGNDWRFYQNESAKVTISTTSGELTSVTFTFSVANGGTLKYGSSTVTNGTAVDVSGESAEFTVGNSGNATNGQVKITAITVNYDVTGTGTTYYWSSPVAAAVETPEIVVAENPFLFSTTATITCATEGATIKYSFDGENWNDYSEALTITETKTIYAKAIKDSQESSVAQVTATKNLAEPTVTISDQLITHTNVYEGTAAGRLTASVKYNDEPIEGATVTWSGDNDAVAKINASTGSVDLVASGTVTFTATFASNSDYSEKSAEYVMTVTYQDPNAPGTQNNPYTVAQAIDAIDNNGNVTGVYVKGIICQVDAVNPNSYATYWISEDGTTTNKFQIYHGYYLDGANFTDNNQIQVGDEVVVSGDITYYQKSSIYEFSTGSTLQSLKLVAPTFYPETGAVASGTEITISDLHTDATIYYTTDGTDPTTNNTAYDSGNKPTITAETTFKAIAVKDGCTTSDAATASYIILYPAATPTFSPEGGTYTSVQNVTISSDTEDATIYYTLDGSDPTTSSIKYTEAIVVDETVTIKAIAVKEGMANSAVASATYTMNIPSIDAEDVDLTYNTTAGSIDFTITNPAEGTLTAAIIEGNWLTLGTISDNAVAFTCSANEGSEDRTAIVKLTYTYDTNKTVDKEVTITQAYFDFAQLPFTFNGGRADIEETDGLTQEGLGTDYNANNNPTTKLKFDSTGDWMILTINEIPGTLTFDIKGNGFSSGTFTVQTSADGTTYTDLATYTDLGDTQTETFNNLAADVMYIKWIYTNKSNGNVGLGNITLGNTMAVAIAAACTDGTKCYSTFSSSKPFIVPEDLTVSEIGIEDGTMNVVNYATGETVPANTGVMVSATDGGNYVVNISKEAGTSKLGTNNALRPSGPNGITAEAMNNEPVECKFYRLTMHGKTDTNPGKIGFWWGAENGAAFAVAANKAYLAVPASVAGARSGFAFGDDATGISQIENGKLKIENYYDLQGRKVSKPGKGLYIVNGKKVVIK